MKFYTTSRLLDLSYDSDVLLLLTITIYGFVAARQLVSSFLSSRTRGTWKLDSFEGVCSFVLFIGLILHRTQGYYSFAQTTVEIHQVFIQIKTKQQEIHPRRLQYRAYSLCQINVGSIRDLIDAVFFSG